MEGLLRARIAPSTTMKLKRSDWIAIAIVVSLAAGVWYLRSGRGGIYLNLIDQFPRAEQRSSLAKDQAFRLVEPVINGEKRRAIYMHPTSRLIFHDINVPRHAWLHVVIALSPEVWDKPGDGVLFRFGIADDRSYEELLKQVVNPAGVPDDRRWLPVEIDLSQYAGEKLRFIFNTNSSLVGDDSQNDWALWGEPQIVIRP